MLAYRNVQKAKGKTGTKGAKQIMEENEDTLLFYRNMAIGTSLFHGVLISFVFKFSWFNVVSTPNVFRSRLRTSSCNSALPAIHTTQIMSLVCLSMMMGAYQFMVYITKVKHDAQGAVIDCGFDLNMEGGTAEHAKDMVILISITFLLTSLTNWFYVLLLLIPARIFVGSWGTIIKPLLLGTSDEAVAAEQTAEQEKEEKRRARMERRAKKMRG